MDRNWQEELISFTEFLKNIDVEKYSNLRQIKTVEQDLTRDLLPLEIFYRFYWESYDFKDFDEVFRIYWNEKLSPYIYDFIKKYFYGCSLMFVEEGFRARLYRIWMSILTQFQFQYLWNAKFQEKLYSSADLDSLGIDAVVELGNKKIGLQIKKISLRREASDRRFTRRQQKYADIIAEIPYLVLDTEDLKNKLKSSRVKQTNKEKYYALLQAFTENFIKYQNGFVVFAEAYLQKIYNVIMTKLADIQPGQKISYSEFLSW